MEIDRSRLEELCKFLENDEKVIETIKKIIMEKPDSVAKLIAYELSGYIRRNPDIIAEIAKNTEKKEEPKKELPMLPKEVIDANFSDTEKKIYYMLMEKAERGKK